MKVFQFCSADEVSWRRSSVDCAVGGGGKEGFLHPSLKHPPLHGGMEERMVGGWWEESPAGETTFLLSIQGRFRSEERREDVVSAASKCSVE